MLSTESHIPSIRHIALGINFLHLWPFATKPGTCVEAGSEFGQCIIIPPTTVVTDSKSTSFFK